MGRHNTTQQAGSSRVFEGSYDCADLPYHEGTRLLWTPASTDSASPTCRHAKAGTDPGIASQSGPRSPLIGSGLRVSCARRFTNLGRSPTCGGCSLCARWANAVLPDNSKLTMEDAKLTTVLDPDHDMIARPTFASATITAEAHAAVGSYLMLVSTGSRRQSSRPHLKQQSSRTSHWLHFGARRVGMTAVNRPVHGARR
jgi:hypothetical protein